MQKARLLKKSDEFKSSFQTNLGAASKQIEGIAIGAGLVALSLLLIFKLSKGSNIKDKDDSLEPVRTNKTDTSKLLLSFITKNATLVALNIAKEKLLNKVKSSPTYAKRTA